MKKFAPVNSYRKLDTEPYDYKLIWLSRLTKFIKAITAINFIVIVSKLIRECLRIFDEITGPEPFCSKRKYFWF